MALRYGLDVDDKGSAKLRRFGDEADRADRRMAGMIRSTQQGIGSFVKFGAKALAAYAAVRSVTRALGFLHSASTERRESSLLMTRALGHESQALRDQARALAETTSFSAIETQRMQTRMAEYIRSEKTISGLTAITQDFAAATGKDLVQAGALVSKTLASNDNALQRYGITVTGAAGSSERLASLTNALSSRFAGAAEEASKADNGLQAMKNSARELAADLGEVMGPAVQTITEKIREMLKEWRTFLAERKDPNKEVRKDLVRVNGLLAIQKAELKALQEAGTNPKAPLAAKKTQERIAFLQEEIAANEKLREAMDDQFNKNLSRNDPPPEVKGTGVIVDKEVKKQEVVFHSGITLQQKLDARRAQAEAQALEQGRQRYEAWLEQRYQRSIEAENLMQQARMERMTEEERARFELEQKRDERLLFAGENEKLAHEIRLSYAHELEQMEASFAEKRAAEHEREMARIQSEREGRLSAMASILGSYASLMSGAKGAHKLQKTLLIGEATANTYLAATRALATPPAPNKLASGAALLAGFAQVQQISQKMVVGGLPRGRNAVVMMNEAGQEFVGNAGMTRTVGREFVERGNAGATRDELAELLGARKGGGMVLNFYGAMSERFIEEQVVPVLSRYEKRSR